MNLVEKAIVFASKAHEGQKRKGSDIPYISHPFAVGMMLQKEGCGEDVVAAGILHDTLEDTETTWDCLKEHFGEKVANLVLAVSEQDKTLSWEERKKETILKLENAPIEEIQIVTADKLHNLQSIKNDLKIYGEGMWARFKRGRNAQHWYYASITNILMKRKQEFSLIETLADEAKSVFGSLESPNH